jgi:hypothetical protein
MPLVQLHTPSWISPRGGANRPLISIAKVVLSIAYDCVFVLDGGVTECSSRMKRNFHVRFLERVSNIDDLDSPASPPPDFKAFGGYWNATQVFLKHALES